MLVIVCSVVAGWKSTLKIQLPLRAKNSVKSPYFTAKDFAFATA